MKTNRIIVVVAMVIALFSLRQAGAGWPVDVTVATPGLGSDMWTSAFARKGMFLLHTDDCATGEAFVDLATDMGYCIEEDERSAETWEEARQTCLENDMRLPEPAEYKYACTRRVALSLNDMVEDWEWASNFPHGFIDHSASYAPSGLQVAKLGNGGCSKGMVGEVATLLNGELSIPFRCVR